MRKKIIFALGSIASFVAVKALAATLLASPGYIAAGCSWNSIGGGSYPPVTVSVTGLFCNGAGPILVKQVVTQPGGSSSCTLYQSGSPDLYTYSSPLTCNSYSVSTK
ncbi:MAG: hypothetical protein B0W54_12995 [Cellvibrio sp. 79]|nr:MAG: hypothetical protein B0W54_12995 [Cellvibrio sp. 79]